VTAAAGGIPGATRCWPVYVQAKRYTGRHVGGPDVQAVAGAPPRAQASRGVFIATPGFSQDTPDRYLVMRRAV
jgi:restriction endonuclease Mrr